MTGAVFLDRDGVLNRAHVRGGRPYPPANLAEVEVLDEAREACAALRAAGFWLLCVTNQPDVARGTANAGEVDAINAHIAHELGLDRIYVCTHDDADQCDCRKPKPGMLFNGAADYSIDLKQSFLIGDRWRDIDAGRAAGCRTIFINRHYSEKQPDSPDALVETTAQAAAWILAQDKNASSVTAATHLQPTSAPATEMEPDTP